MHKMDTLASEKPCSLIVRFFAKVVSYVFHPLFIPLYVTLFLMYIHPSCFVGYDSRNNLWLLLRVGYNTIFFPAFTVFLLSRLNFIDSILLKTQKDRIIPYIASGIFYFWIYWVMRNSESVPKMLTLFLFGVFLATSAALIVNIYMKISMHAIGAGGMLGVFYLIMKNNTMLMTWPLAMAILIAGLVCTSRLIIGNHSIKEIISGILVGLLTQITASYVI